MATSDESLEILLNRATDPSLPEEDWDRISAFCNKVNVELEGPLLSTRLIAHKIQSPQEKEALYALSTLEACVKECGRYFHQEIGKFRFLNELIKVVSPKYLGNRTTEAVKKRCIEIIYSWYKGLTHEPKIGEAYQMLKSQGIIKEDPTYMDKKFSPFPPPKQRKADFEDDEKAKTLERLLRSKNPEDLQAANRMIKNMVKEDMEKTEKRSRRINELESVSNQVKLLTEMIGHYSPSSSSKEELEMMKELYDNLEKQRPNLFRLASDTDENDNEGINQILKANDSVTRVMTLYKERVEGESPVGDYSKGAKDSSLLDVGLEALNKSGSGAQAPASSASNLLENDFKMLGLGDMSELGSIFSSAPTQQQPSASLQSQFQMPMMQAVGPTTNSVPAFSQPSPFAGLSTPWSQASAGPAGAPPAYNAISHNVRPSLPTDTMMSTGSVFQQTNNPAMGASGLLSATPAKPASNTPALADLDILDKSLQDYKLSKESFPSKVPPTKLPLNQLATSKAAGTAPLVQPVTAMASTDTFTGQMPLKPQPASGSKATPVSQPFISPPVGGGHTTQSTNGGDFTEMVSAAPEPPPELLPLTDVFVPLETIQPAPNIPSVTAYDKNNVKVAVHFAKDRPRPDVITMVVSTLSTNASPITGFVFQAAVPKIMKVKLQPPSASDFPAYNPILPPAAITQVMLVANPRKERVRLKYKLSYTLEGKVVSDVGDIDNIPIQ